MVRKKSSAAKVKARKEAYKRQVGPTHVGRSWRILLLTVTAINKFLRFKRCNVVSAYLQPSFNTLHIDMIASDSITFINEGKRFTSLDKANGKLELEIATIVKSITKKIVSKVCRLENERNRQVQMRKRIKSSNISHHDETTILKHNKQSTRLKEKYLNDTLYRKKKKNVQLQAFEIDIRIKLIFVRKRKHD